jgi:hypothetical protein
MHDNDFLMRHKNASFIKSALFKTSCLRNAMLCSYSVKLPILSVMDKLFFLSEASWGTDNNKKSQ